MGVACLLALMGGAGCFGNATPSMRPAEDSTAALPQAKAGDAGALHRSFRAAVAEEMRPFPNTGEPAREISDNLDAILLAGTDLALLFNAANADFPHVDCAALHLDAIVNELLADPPPKKVE